MKFHLNELLTAAGVFMAAIGVYVLFSIQTVLADHDKDDKAHPTLKQAVMSVEGKMDLLALKQELNQQANDDAHKRHDESNKRMVELLVSINDKI